MRQPRLIARDGERVRQVKAPREIDGMKVLKAADLSDATATGNTRHYRDGALQSGFAGLAIAEYAGDSGFYLLYCDERWECLNDTHHENLEGALAQAEFEFGPGLHFTDT